MARIFKAMAGLAYDNIDYNPTLTLPYLTVLGSGTASPYEIADYLTLQLANKQDEVLVDGQFNFIFTGAAVDPTDSINVLVQVYTDEARTNQVYETEWIVSGITLIATQSIQWTVPIQFQENPLLKVTENTVNYYISIAASVTGITLGVNSLQLTQYDVSANEIGINKGFTC